MQWQKQYEKHAKWNMRYMDRRDFLVILKSFASAGLCGFGIRPSKRALIAAQFVRQTNQKNQAHHPKYCVSTCVQYIIPKWYRHFGPLLAACSVLVLMKGILKMAKKYRLPFWARVFHFTRFYVYGFDFFALTLNYFCILLAPPGVLDTNFAF